jgi:hypothetical protein
MPSIKVSLIRKVQIVGGVLFLLSFLLPVMRIDAVGVLRGYECAELSGRFLFEAFRSLFPHTDPGIQPWILVLILGMSGLINPLVLWYLIATPKWRRRVAILICAFFIETWIGFWIGNYVPLIGHFCWFAGALLLMAPEIRDWQGDPTEES